MNDDPKLPTAVMDALPNPVLVKDADTRYVWVNAAFERLFEVRCSDLIGRLDTDVFPEREATQCNGDDLRVLESGEIDEARETVVDPNLGPRETVTRKSRLIVDHTHYLVGVMHDITEAVEKNRMLEEAGEALQHQADELDRLASTDHLTGCHNRRALFEWAATGLDDLAALGVIALDLDHFRAINDTHGHDGGDEVLRSVVDTMRGLIRSDEDIIARIGGEEFVVVLPGASPEDTVGIANRICAAVSSTPVPHGTASISCSASLGVAHRDGAVGLFDELLHQADQRLYEAKALGCDRVVSA